MLLNRLPVLEDEPAGRALVLLRAHVHLLDVPQHVALLPHEPLPLLEVLLSEALGALQADEAVLALLGGSFSDIVRYLGP